MTGSLDEAALERSAMRRIGWRLVPFLILAYFVSFLDRVNVGFAAIQMNHDVGLSATVFGWGAGIFFLGYFLMEIPSNLMLERFGARLWIARIMATWGLISAAMALVQGPWSFIGLRFLLGLAEAGFFPGVILYLTYWFPSAYRARIIGIFMISIPISSFLGSPISGALLNVTGLGLAGWQWLFILEGLPAVFLAVAVLWFLPDGPRDAAWLPAAERDWLERQLRAEAARNTRRGQPAKPPLWDILRDRRLALFAAIYFGSTASSYGLSFWTPQIVKSFGLGNVETGLLNSIPYGFASLAMVLWGRHSDRTAERRWHLALSFLILALGLAGGTVLSGLGPVVAALTIAAMGVYMLKGPFWALATEQMPPATAAASIAAINAVGNLGGFLGPYLIGAIKDGTGSFTLSLLPLVIFALLSAALSLVPGRAPRPDQGTPRPSTV
ncbi:ACS family tartrate transporter-like MFS transporter [Methylobacterium sp. PvP062]|jgi:ACS family tartrate transporter-like MFS transporter|uniref:Major facilitator superfamily MFS_1 n=2 Tax=Methylobacterium radiotolerans TaxID=31998 RepID=B1M2H7_METRJ|nr:MULTISPECIES: MFS transporter [Methylobacterium]MCX7330760.1 MFS transporter [Hyphomicrobiales bacterium]GAN52570.1 major facilitator transporter [Methylobacterium sp. ME121]ACB26217.1 major facilitator superfamily MFS_1 [Methylobacterium radiotolerans JCM 2831]KIU30147.1 membrane protein [Methylobacterium radiotolerans]KTS10087.1 membrane protein [Methylobacterium radiotolerans]